MVEGKNLQLKYPVCFECFDSIIMKLGNKIHSQESERDIYMTQLSKLEAKLAAAKTESELEAELKELETEEQNLDKEL